MSTFNTGYLEQKIKNLAQLKLHAAKALSLHFNCKTEELLYKFLKNELPHTGTTDLGDHYMFHGYGCSFKSSNSAEKVELEFGPKGAACSFDKFSLCKHLGYPIDMCDHLIDELTQNNIIHLVDPLLNSLLISNGYYLDWESEEQEIDACVADRYRYIE